MIVRNHLPRRHAFLLLLAATTLFSSHQALGQRTKARKTTTSPMDSVSYALGVLFATNLSNEGFSKIDGESLRQGFEQALAGLATLSPQEADGMVRMHMTKLKEEAGKKSLEEGEAFLAENASKEGVVTTESGLQYEVLVEGNGASPKATDEVTVHYRGTLLNGEEFDSSIGRGQPATFPLNGVIRGWTEGLQTMKVGGKTRFFIPQDLAYGARPAPGGKIPPYAALIFEVELLNVTARD